MRLSRRYVPGTGKDAFSVRPMRDDGTEQSGAHNAHNHPSGVAEPSRADELLTQNLKSALALVDVKVLDHFVVAGTNTVSFAERGLI